MFSVKEMPSPSSMFSVYASLTASMMLVRSMINELIPRPVRDYLISVFCYLFKVRSRDLTLVIEEEDGISNNQLYKAAEIFLGTKISLANERIKIYKTPNEKGLKLRLEKGEKIVDNFQGIELVWRFICKEEEKNNERRGSSEQQNWFELNFVKKHKEKVLDSYIPHVLEKSKELKEEERVLKMHSKMYGNMRWDSINLEHPSTFETIAMEPDLKNALINDLDRFIKRKKFYKRVGRAWKRGYLLYGPPGTGKSSLVAAMANYLKFDVYDLQLGSVRCDSELRRLLLATGNRSILVIEDIDCSVDLPERQNKQNGDDQKPHNRFQLTLSGLLNFIDGLWSSCGDERIIVFTTNHQEKLDPALLRPGRMDMHIHMSYCTFEGFKMLASSYLEITDYHHLYKEIECLIGHVKITPAQVAEELMKSEDADIALEGLVKLLKKSLEAEEIVDEVAINGTQ